MPRIIITEKDREGNTVATHYYRKPSKPIGEVQKIDEIVGGKAHFYSTGMGAKLSAFPLLRPLLDRLGILNGRVYSLDVDYSWTGDTTARQGGAGRTPHFEE